MNKSTEVWTTLPANQRDETARQLEAGETLLACFEPDLDQRLCYATGLIVLTDRRVLASAMDGVTPAWQTWPVTAHTRLRTVEHGGAGTLELVDASGRLAHWRCTIGRGTAAQRLAQKLAAWHAIRDGTNGAAVTAVCPSCGAAIQAEDGRCAACAAGPIKPSVSALVRLAAFARPRAA